METKKLLTVVLIGMMVSAVWAKPPKMKMTTEIPEGIVTPNTLQTRVGTLNLVDGVPDEATVQKVYDNLDFQRGVEAFMGLSLIHISEPTRPY